METHPVFRPSTLRIVPSSDHVGSPSSSRPGEMLPVDASTLYAPPYHSALADGFVWNLVKYLAPAFDLSVDEQSGGTVVTLAASATGPGRSPRFISFAFARLEECAQNAQEATTNNVGQEAGTEGEKQQTFLANVTEVVPPGVFYVLRPEDIVHRLPDVLALMAKWDPALFSERGAVNLERLSSNEAQARRVTPICTEALLSYPDDRSASCLLLDPGMPVPETLVVQRKMRPRSSPPASPSSTSHVPKDSPSGPNVARNQPHRCYARSA